MSEWLGKLGKACTICWLRGIRLRGMHGSRIRSNPRSTTSGFEFGFKSGRADCRTVSDWCSARFDALPLPEDPSREINS
jgi:hypothetical protein